LDFIIATAVKALYDVLTVKTSYTNMKICILINPKMSFFQVTFLCTN